MFFAAWVYGELQLPEGQFSRWLSQPLQAKRLPDFVVDDAGCDEREPLVLLEKLHQQQLSAREFLGVGADTGHVSVRGLLNDRSLLSTQGVLTALFGSAVGHGGDGRLLVVGRDGGFGYEVQVCCGALRARSMDVAERMGFLESRACAELLAREEANHQAYALMVQRAGDDDGLAAAALEPRPTAPSAHAFDAADSI